MKMGGDVGLKYVYSGNIPYSDSNNTRCHNCGGLLIERHAFTVTAENIADGKCPECTVDVEGVWT